MRHHHCPGDLGKRVAGRRQELGLSRRQLADRAGMAMTYIEYLEDQPAIIGMGGLMRLADALETTSAALLGADSAALPGAAQPAGTASPASRA